MRQHTTPVMLSGENFEAEPLLQLSLGTDGHGTSEAVIQGLVHRFPSVLPINEIDPLFIDPVPICMELNTPAGSIDNFLITASGLPVLVECKLWKNPEGRREVIGQILDYAKELSQLSASDLQREVSKRLQIKGNAIIDLVRDAGHDIEEMSFIDSLSFNLRRGRFLLLIVGDGIREGVESIVDYVQAHSGLHFTLGLVEMPIYGLPSGAKMVVPRVVAKTLNILRTVIQVPSGYMINEDDEGDGEEISQRVETPERKAGRERRNAVRKQFWSDFLTTLALDEPEQLIPSPALGGHVVFKFGAPGGSSWLTVYRDMRADSVGLFMSGNANSIGERAMQNLNEDAEAIRNELGPEATVNFERKKPDISQTFGVTNLEDPSDRQAAINWLQERTNTFVNVLRPRIRAQLRRLEED